jgi:hypothetical protein
MSIPCQTLSHIELGASLEEIQPITYLTVSRQN